MPSQLAPFLPFSSFSFLPRAIFFLAPCWQAGRKGERRAQSGIKGKIGLSVPLLQGRHGQHPSNNRCRRRR